MTIEKIRRTNECLWHGEGQEISPSSSGRQAGRQPRHKAARTKELRRCTIRARDGRTRIEGDRGVGFKDGRRFTKVLEGQQGKYTKVRRTEGRKEEVLYRDAHGVRGWGRERGGVFCLSDIKEPVANFLPSLHRPPLSCPRDHTRPCSIHPHTRVPGRSSGVPGGSLGHRRMVNVGSRNAGTASSLKG